ncbi:RAD55 family ATPase [Pyrobaculum sp. 3827-6]|uniref:RAD55 family ATPase n=1 Tax=Pyrobaculum sp. 3827-6 TaxID=2983604 RepID=UPI0021DB402D|nr:RAD55 family ATPase [Pyrobaculum sp. 3827-6]MCU7787685.1 RAD55 family ATPase [Pyrobaculum sp. 3827-6]
MKLRGVTLVYGPPGAGKTTLTAWYVHGNYDKVFWVSAFEDEVAFRKNMAALGYDFGDRLVFWEAPLIEAGAFFNTLVDSVIRERPGALVIDSITEFLSLGGGVDIIHNVVYRVIKQAGIDVFLTAEREVAEKVAYIADNVIELVYDLKPYGAIREMLVKKVRGGKAGYSVPFVIAEGSGVILFEESTAPTSAVEVVETGWCLDAAAGGLYKGLLHSVVGPMGAGKNWFIINTARALMERGRKVRYIDMATGGLIYAESRGVPALRMEMNFEELLVTLYKLAREGYDAVFIRGLDLVRAMYGDESLYKVLKVLRKIAQMGPAIVVSLRDLEKFDMFFDVVIRVNKGVVQAVRAPGGKVGVDIPC